MHQRFHQLDEQALSHASYSASRNCPEQNRLRDAQTPRPAPPSRYRSTAANDESQSRKCTPGLAPNALQDAESLRPASSRQLPSRKIVAEPRGPGRTPTGRGRSRRPTLERPCSLSHSKGRESTRRSGFPGGYRLLRRTRRLMRTREVRSSQASGSPKTAILRRSPSGLQRTTIVCKLASSAASLAAALAYSMASSWDFKVPKTCRSTMICQPFRAASGAQTSNEISGFLLMPRRLGRRMKNQ